MKIKILILMILMSQTLLAQDTGPYKEGSIIHDGEVVRYRYLLPENFNEKEKYPLVLFLHGAGERGDDNEKQLIHGSKLFSDSLTKYPAVAIFPQCPSDSYWASVNSSTDESGKRKFTFPANPEPTKAMQQVLYLLDSVIQEGYIDKSRIYVTGLSMGGMGTFEILNYRPEIFAAAAPICGGAHPDIVKKYNPQTSFWIFHGAEDAVVPPVHSTIMVKALQENGFEVRYNLYPDINHNSWDNAFNEPTFLSWLFSKKLNKN